MLNNTSPWCLTVCIIDCGIPLIIFLIQKFCLKSY